MAGAGGGGLLKAPPGARTPHVHAENGHPTLKTSSVESRAVWGTAHMSGLIPRSG